MPRHWIIRIRKPSTSTVLSIFIGGTAVLCAFYFIKRLFSNSSSRSNARFVQGRSKTADSGFSYISRSRLDETSSTRSPVTALSNRKSCSRMFSRRTSLSTAAPLVVDCGTIGLGTLNKIVEQLENCINKINTTIHQSDAKDTSTDILLQELQKFLETSYLLREQFKRTFIQQTPAFTPELQCFDSFSDESESYFSTVEEIDFSELELQILSNFHRPLYRSALRELNNGNPTLRYIRTEMMNCLSDIEYLGKVICIRHGFDYIFDHAEHVAWLTQVGRSLACGTLICLGSGTSDFEEAYLILLEYLESLKDPQSLTKFVDELASKGIQSLNFYDIFFDRILIDALENLSDPPSSILALTRNTWLSPSFKRSALNSAVWTIMTAKRKLLKYPDGFFAIYYRVVETVAAPLAWGFLGSDNALNIFCDSFRNEVVTFVRSLFRFGDADASNAEDGVSSSSAYLEFVENESDSEDDTTLIPDGDSRVPPHGSYMGMDFTSIEALSACICANFEVLQRQLASLIVDFSMNANTPLQATIIEGLKLSQPPLSGAYVNAQTAHSFGLTTNAFQRLNGAKTST